MYNPFKALKTEDTHSAGIKIMTFFLSSMVKHTAQLLPPAEVNDYILSVLKGF